MYVINAPIVFTSVWAVVKQLVDAKTRAKVDILGSKYSSKLLADIDADCLPQSLGGNDETFDVGADVGPWCRDDAEIGARSNLIRRDCNLQVRRRDLRG